MAGSEYELSLVSGSESCCGWFNIQNEVGPAHLADRTNTAYGTFENLNQYEKALPYYKRAVEIDNQDPIRLNNFLGIFNFL